MHRAARWDVATVGTVVTIVESMSRVVCLDRQLSQTNPKRRINDAVRVHVRCKEWHTLLIALCRTSSCWPHWLYLASMQEPKRRV